MRTKIIGYATVIGLAVATMMGPTLAHHTACRAVDVGPDSGVSFADVYDMLQDGWHGDGTDNSERLYPPACH